MTRAQFLNDLYRRLGSLSKEQAEQHLTYYAEMLMDRMEEGMSEEEAVASMEPVEEIARRILREEGAPPVYTEPAYTAQRPEEQTTPAAAAPEVPVQPARDWKKIVRIALWAAAILALVWVVAGKFRRPDRAAGTDSGSAPTLSEASDASGGRGGIYIGPDGIEIGGGDSSIRVGPDGIAIDGEDWEDWEDFGEAWEDFGEGWEWSDWADTGSYDSYPGDSYSLAAAGIKEIRVDWTAGVVEIMPGEDGEINFLESSDRELTDKEKMVYEVDGDTLRIRFRDRSGGINISHGKKPMLTVPSGLLEDLEVNTTSADLWMSSLRLEDLEVAATSGAIHLDSLSARSADLKTTSGDISLQQVESGKVKVSSTSGNIRGSVLSREVKAASSSGNITLSGEDGDKYELDTTSGNITLDVAAASELELESTSGDISLTLPGALGFTLEHKTTSGDLDSGDFALTRRNGKYISGNGACEIEVDTVSGDLTLAGA